MANLSAFDNVLFGRCNGSTFESFFFREGGPGKGRSIGKFPRCAFVK